jgi:hypothetical protein
LVNRLASLIDSISDIDTIADSEDDVVGRLPAPQSRGLIYSDSRLSR